MKLPNRNNVVATVAILTMALLCVVAVKALREKPEVMTSTRTIILPNDSLITLREQLAAANARCMTLQTVADTRAQMLFALTAPIQAIADSTLQLQRSINTGNDVQRAAIETDRSDRADRYSSLKSGMDDLKASQPNIAAMFERQNANLSSLLTRPADTVEIHTAGSFWYRLTHLFTKSNRR